MRSLSGKLILALLVTLAVFLTGCSKDTPMQPISASDSNLGTPFFAPTGDQIQLTGKVATIDPAARTLTLDVYGYPIVAADDCEIVRMEYGVEIPVTFDYIKVGDSILSCGQIQEDYSILAQRLRIYGECDNEPVCDVSFRDTIVTINYAAGTFTVAGRTETITIDENTLIWGRNVVQEPGGADVLGFVADDGQAVLKLRPDHGYHSDVVDTVFEFTDLKAGDVVEVCANVVDPGTLLALSIKLANCDFRVCTEFSAYLATIDCDTRIVTFEGLSWIGTVCPNAELLDLDGNPVTLCDFAVGDYVTIKSFPLEGDSLYICRILATEP
jgi:hypothetical protein